MQSFDLDVQNPVVHVDTDPGGTVVLRGFFHSSFDGADIDAATTTWPSSAPGGAAVGASGMVDFEAGGLHLSSRDPKSHVVTAVSTGRTGRACAAAHVASPCVVLRTLPEARGRLLTMDEFDRSLSGKITVGSSQSAAPDPSSAGAAIDSGFLLPAGGSLGVVLVAAAGALLLRARRKSARGQLEAQLARLDQKLTRDPLVGASLRPLVEQARSVIRNGRVDPRSPEGIRLCAALAKLEQRLEHMRASEQAAAEREIADELLGEMESAIEAAQEARAVGRKRDDKLQPA